jgi:integrase
VATIYKRKYKATLPNGKTVTRKCEHYVIQYVDANGKDKRITPRINGEKIRDKAIAETWWADHIRAKHRVAVGHASAYDAQMAVPMSEHIAEYAADLRTTGRDSHYVYVAERRLKILEKQCGWATLADINATSFARWRNQRRKTGNPHGKGNLTDKGAAATTLNQFLETARAFTNWCAATQRLQGVAIGSRIISPLLSGVARADGPKVRKRRALSDDEVTKLLGVTPAERKLFTRVGISLGLRRSELEQLQWGDLRLAAIKPYVQLRAEATKARRGDRLDIPATLADDLRAERPADAKDTALVFPTPPNIDDWKADLTAAGIKYKDDMGNRADFHAGTRKTMCSRMHRQNVPLAVAMRRMRHTDAKLTMVDYTDDQQIGMDAATLPELLPAAPAGAVASASA